ncbi:MAG: AraC family transcriptional regulator [Prevotella sp.]|nr:AraC family transcriptional regulator [Prevotella sp.]
MLTVTTLNEFNAYFHQPTAHPLVGVGDLSRADLSLFEPTKFDMYAVVLMDVDFGELVKGGMSMRYDAGTIFWLSPGQDVAMNLDYRVKPRGMMLAFKPELIERTGLGRDFYMFNFFNHDVNAALTLTSVERGIMLNSYANIQAELLSKRDYLSDHMIRLGIGMLLSYCKRFFESQYEERSSRSKGIFERLDQMIDNYLSSSSPAQHGQPTVAWCAEQFSLSANYFGELVRKEIHITAQEYIQGKIIHHAKHLLRDTPMTINEIGSELGFTYTTHFSRMFRKKTGMSPQEFRHQKDS